jgi:hypothetical protein
VVRDVLTECADVGITIVDGLDTACSTCANGPCRRLRAPSSVRCTASRPSRWPSWLHPQPRIAPHERARPLQSAHPRA